MNGFKSILFLLAGVASLSFAAANEAPASKPEVKAPEKKEGEPEEWNTTVNSLWKNSEEMEKKLKTEVDKLKEPTTSKAALETFKVDKTAFKANVDKFAAAKKTYDTSKKTEDATAVSVAGIAAVKGFEPVHEKYGAALRVIATASVLEHGTVAELKYAKTRFLESFSNSAFMYTILPLLATAAFVLV